MWRIIARFSVAGAFVIFTTITLWGQASSYSESVVTIYTTIADGRIKQGSGFVVDGGIVTAYHVVQGAKTIEIVTSNNQDTTDVTVLAYDPASDIALVSAQFRSPIRPLSLLDQLPPVDRDLLMVGSAAGLPNSVYTVRPVRQELMALKALNDTGGKPLFDNPPTLDVIQLAGVIYGGISGGPLLTRDKAVVGILSGSLTEGGSYGWVIPARRAIALIRGQTSARVPSSITWDPIPLRSANLRTTEYFVRRNETTATQLSAFVQKTNRLSAINDTLDIGLKEVLFQNIANGLQVQWETPRLNPLGPLTVQEVNSYAQTYLQSDYSMVRNDFAMLRSRLLERYAIDKHRPERARNRTDLDPATNSQRIKLAVGSVIDDQQDVAADTYERRYAVDTQNLVAALNRLSGRPTILQFSSLADAHAFVADLQTCLTELEKYAFSSPFLAWRSNENRFFTSIGSVLKKFEPIAVVSVLPLQIRRLST